MMLWYVSEGEIRMKQQVHERKKKKRGGGGKESEWAFSPDQKQQTKACLLQEE